MGKTPEIREIRIKKVANLSPSAQAEVRTKLEDVSESFNFRGYAKVSYVETSPLRVISVDPIEGDTLDILEQIFLGE